MTKIEWTQNDDGTRGKTWNPVRGCSRVSPGCDKCYAISQAHRFSGPGKPYDGLTILRPKTASRPGVDWSGRARFVPEMLGEPLKWRKPQRVFVNSMSDLFHESLTNEEILRIFAVMAVCPHHTFQVLTKRPARASTWFRDVDLFRLGEQMRALDLPANGRSYPRTADVWPLPNVWLGVSTEDQKTADERIPLLLELPAAVRFISAEPLLGPLNLHPWFCEYGSVERPGQKFGSPCEPSGKLDWLIVGGESGNGARPFDLDWAKALVEQCDNADVACFVKQIGSRPCMSEAAWRDLRHGIVPLLSPRSEHPMVREAGLVQLAMNDRKGGNMAEWPEALRVRQFPEVRRG